MTGTILAAARRLRPGGRFLRALVLASLFGAAISVVSADNTDQTNGGKKYAWGENVGWISARPTGEAYGPGGSGMQITDTDALGYLWGENIGWINLSCKNDSTCGGGAGNWGVKNDGTGVLSGYAWAENAGWISFNCSNNPSSCAGTGNYGVTIANYDITTLHSNAGIFQGYAYGENIGWINFNCANRGTCGTVSYYTQTGAPDSDGDGCRDSKEPGLTLDLFNPWDFYSVPIPPLFLSPSPTTDIRDNKIAASDAQAVFAYFKKSAKTGSLEYEQDLDANGVKDGWQYDRTVVGPSKSGPPDGIVSAADAQLAFAQFKLGHNC